MNILFLSRKFPGMIGGLARFITELTRGFRPFAFTRLPDLIHVTDATLLLPGVLLKMILGKPLIVTAHGLDITWNHIVYQWVLRRFLPHVDALVVDSPATRTLLDRYQYPKNRIHTILPGVSVRHFSKKLPLPIPDMTGKTVLLTVSNLVPRKGHVWFIRHVLPKLPSRFFYVIVGDGPQRRAIERTTRILHLSRRVLMLGNIKDEELSYLFSEIADIYVAPNLHIPHNFEGFGIAAGEAAAMGLPVVASRIDGLPSVIHHNKNGLLVSVTPKDWIKALRSVEPLKVRTAMGRRAQRYTRSHFSWRKTIAEYSRTIQEVGGKRKSSPKRFSPT